MKSFKRVAKILFFNLKNITLYNHINRWSYNISFRQPKSLQFIYINGKIYDTILILTCRCQTENIEWRITIQFSYLHDRISKTHFLRFMTYIHSYAEVISDEKVFEYLKRNPHIVKRFIDQYGFDSTLLNTDSNEIDSIPMQKRKCKYIYNCFFVYILNAYKH